jgi:hypothetical protein
VVIDADQSFERLRGVLAGSHQLQAERPVIGVDERLRGYRTDTGLGPKHDRAHGKPV